MCSMCPRGIGSTLSKKEALIEGFTPHAARFTPGVFMCRLYYRPPLRIALSVQQNILKRYITPSDTYFDIPKVRYP